MGISNFIFAAILLAATFLFAKQVKRIRRNILLGKDLDISDRKPERWKNMIRVALGQSKMVKRPVAGILHIIVYLGFVIINLEVLEIVIDGVFGTHRVFAFLGPVYDVLIGSFEILALLVLVSCVIFLIRRNLLGIQRFLSREMKGWPKTDANLILITEIVLMAAFLTMNAADYRLQGIGIEGYTQAGSFPVSGVLSNVFMLASEVDTIILVERICWWVHIVGILAFLNYLPISKHFHIILAFPNTYYANLEPKGKFQHMKRVQQEVELMMDPAADPYATPVAEGPIETFGANDVSDLNWKQVMDAYTCTECGRCTSVCPANQTGKLLSPRAIMMGTRDRADQVGKLLDQKKEDQIQQGGLFDHITAEEVWACTSCNACVEACPIEIDPLSIILDMRRYLVMEKSQPPAELATMFTNIENNGAPWQFAQADRLKWADELNAE